jgi:hypothetical protein
MQTKRWAANKTQDSGGVGSVLDYDGQKQCRIHVHASSKMQTPSTSCCHSNTVPKFARVEGRDLARELTEVKEEWTPTPQASISSLIVFALGGSFRQSDEREFAPENEAWMEHGRRRRCFQMEEGRKQMAVLEGCCPT